MIANVNPKVVAVYCRVSTGQQDTRSQEPDLERWAEAQGEEVTWYKDKFSGKTMRRPAWDQLWDRVKSGRVSKIVVWRMDRLGRTAAGLTALFEELRQRHINLVSLRDGLDLETSAGRLMANVLASVAQFETEVRGERVRAGQAVAKAKGKKWGGSKKGVRKKVKPAQIRTIHRMRLVGETLKDICDTVQLSKPTVIGILKTVPWSTTIPHEDQATLSTAEV
ncbi:MAG: recombinase family protein [Pirellulaceae bacterium]